MKILLSVLALVSSCSIAQAEVRERDPSKLSTGKVFEWKSADGLRYQYRLPKGYDEEAGAGLTFILHGSNLSRTWGFANHKADSFRPDDIVVCPDGTTSNGSGGFNFMGQDEDVERLHELHEELKKTLKVNATYIYGHSQGSFFALHYAGAKPDAVQGVVAHASGLWTWTQMPEAAHHQAIVFMHSDDDRVVPYGQSLGGYGVMVERGYPMVRMRTLHGRGHYPVEHGTPIAHTSQQLAWVEGMTSKDAKRQAAAFKTLSPGRSKEGHDYAALYSLAAHLAAAPDASAGAKRVSQKTMASVEGLVEKHIAALSAPDPSGEIALSDGAWIGHLPRILEVFAGVPAAEELRKLWAGVMEEQREVGNEHFRKYFAAKKAGDVDAGFSAGVAVYKEAFLRIGSASVSFKTDMKTWAEKARDHGLDKAVVKEWKKLDKDYSDGWTDGLSKANEIDRRASF